MTQTIQKRSTCQLLFAHCAAVQKQGKVFEEVSDLFETVPENNFRSKFQTNKFQESRFWRALSTRYWQFDDFGFEGVAAASFLGGAHRYKIWFSPLECYKLLMSAAISFNDKKKKTKKKTKKEVATQEAFADIDEAVEAAQENAIDDWELLINGKSPYQKLLKSDYGWNPELYKEMVASQKQGGWTEKGWELWNFTFTNSEYFLKNIVSIMVHEMMHVLWQHLTRTKFDHQHWNLATDYAINQTVDFTPEIQAVCITNKNESFFDRFVISYVHYALQQDTDIREKMQKKYNLNLTMDIQEFCKVAHPNVNALFQEYMTDDSGGWGQRNDKTSKKPADFYFRILEETMIFSDNEDEDGEGDGEGEGEGSGSGKGKGKGVKGYDNHGQWNEDETDEKGSGDGEDETDEEGEDGDGKSKSAKGGQADQKKKEPKGGKADKGKGEEGNSNTKDRGQGEGVGQSHEGWDIHGACARQEAKGAIRDAMKRSGYNPDDPADIAKCLERTAGMESLGAYITDWFKVPTKNWRQILSKHVASALNPQQLDYTMSRENRRVPDMFPGKRREIGLELIIAVDTSGSINYSDYNDFVGQINKIGRDCDVERIRLIQCHHSIAYDKKIPLRKVKSTPIVETGGTTMRVVYEKLKSEKNKKLLVLFSDCCIDDFPATGWGFKSIIFCSRGNESYGQNLEGRGFKVIYQDQE